MNKKVSLFFLFSSLALVAVLNLYFFALSGPVIEEEAPWRFILGSLMIFVLPGLIWGEVIGFRASHVLECIAFSFTLTLGLEIILLLVVLLSQSFIYLWNTLLLSITFVGLGFLWRKIYLNQQLDFIPFFSQSSNQDYEIKTSQVLILLVLLIMSFGAYRWGEDLVDIGGEKFLHLTFIRYYYALPLALKNLGTHNGFPPQNFIHLWEYLIAAWADLVHVDPLPLFYRSRFVVPVLGLSGMYILINRIFTDRRKSEIILWAVLCMALGGFMLLSPSNLDWVKNDPFRGVFSFMGTSHHSDTAMDILIALGAGLTLHCFREQTWKSIMMVCVVIIASFLWHPREFFQLAVYLGILGIVLIVLPIKEKKKSIKKWLVLLFIFFAVYIVLISAFKLLIPKGSGAYDEMAIKAAALNYLLSEDILIGIRNLFNFPFSFNLPSSHSPEAMISFKQMIDSLYGGWNFYLWLILSAVFVPLSAILGNHSDRNFAAYYIIAWFVILAWNFSMLIICILTYSEIFMATPRMIYIYSYIVIADGIILVAACFIKNNRNICNVMVFLFFTLLSGFIIKFWWHSGVPYVRPLSKALSTILALTLIIIIFPGLKKLIIRYYSVGAIYLARIYRVKTLQKEKKEAVINMDSQFRSILVPILGVLAFLSPVLLDGYSKQFKNIFTSGRPAISWFSDNNPLQVSEELIRFLRSMEPGHNILVNPLGKDCLSIYAPQYLSVFPEIVASVISDRGYYEEVRSNNNPLYSKGLSLGIKKPGRESLIELKEEKVDHKAVIDYLNRSKCDYILINHQHYDFLLPYFIYYPNYYEVAFNNSRYKEILIKYRNRI